MTLTVSLGTQYVTVPDLTNYVQADAEQQLKDLGVSVLVTQAVDTTVASGAVIRTDPAAGSQVAAGSTVVIYISRPQVATTTKVPSLIGMSARRYRKAEWPGEHRGQCRAGACTGTGSTQRQHDRRRLVERPVRRWFVLLFLQHNSEW